MYRSQNFYTVNHCLPNCTCLPILSRKRYSLSVSVTMSTLSAPINARLRRRCDATITNFSSHLRLKRHTSYLFLYCSVASVPSKRQQSSAIEPLFDCAEFHHCAARFFDAHDARNILSRVICRTRSDDTPLIDYLHWIDVFKRYSLPRCHQYSKFSSNRHDFFNRIEISIFLFKYKKSILQFFGLKTIFIL